MIRNKNTGYIYFFGGIKNAGLLAACTLVPTMAAAQDIATSSTYDSGPINTKGLMFLAVLVCIAVVLKIYKGRSLNKADLEKSPYKIKLFDSFSLSPKHKLVVVGISGKIKLLAISNHTICELDTFSGDEQKKNSEGKLENSDQELRTDLSLVVKRSIGNE